MITLQDVLDKLDEMDVAPSEVPVSRAARKYIIGKAQDVVDAEIEEGDEE